jgi:hypothetical protein
VASIGRIEQDIAALNQAVAGLAKEFCNVYTDYLKLLGETARQQLIVAAYHVCTQSYSTQFLALSVNQQQKLQQGLRELAHQLQDNLLAQAQPPTPLEAALPAVDCVSSDGGTELQMATGNATKTANLDSPDQLSPQDLAHWHEALEQGIVYELQSVSHATNRLLQQANILPQKLPDTLLEVASRVETSEVSTRRPNLLTVVIEGIESPDREEKDEEEGEEATPILQMVAVHLRLSDLEFANPAATANRTKLRNLTAQLKTLGRQYYKKQQERTIALAEAAWRASWIED